MPPGPVYNWLCVLHSTANILSHVARIKAAPVVAISVGPLSRKRKKRNEVENPVVTGKPQETQPPDTIRSQVTRRETSEIRLPFQSPSQSVPQNHISESTVKVEEASPDGTTSFEVADMVRVRTFSFLSCFPFGTKTVLNDAYTE